MNKAALFCVLFLLALSGFSQEPADVDITIPPIQAEAEDLLVEDLRVNLPKTSVLPEYELTLPPPEFHASVGGSPNFDLTLPINDAAAPSPRTQDSVFFSEGTIGIGSMNHMLGDLTLYKVGKEPRFSMHFYHSRRDGYQFSDPGSGFFNQVDGIEGKFSIITEPVIADAEGEYSARAEGLQQQSPYESVNHSLLYGKGWLSLKSGGPFMMSFGMAARSSAAVLSSDAPASAEEIAILPTVSASLAFPRFIGRLTADYAYYVRTGPVDASLHRIHSFLELRLPLASRFEVGGTVGVYWFTESGFLVPFSLFLDLRPVSALELKLLGGLKSADESWYDLWTDYPLLWVGAYMPVSKSWYGDFIMDWYILRNLGLGTGLSYEYAIGAAAPSAEIDPLYGMYVPEQTAAHRLSMPFSLEWSPLDFLSFSLGYDAVFLGRYNFEDAFLGTFAMDIASRNGMFGGNIKTAVPVTDTVQVPLVDVGVFLRPVQGVRFLLQAEDILSSAIPDGRRDPGVFKTPGFQITFKANISL